MAFKNNIIDFQFVWKKTHYLKRKIKVCVLKFFFILRNVCDMHKYIKPVLYRVSFSSMRSRSRLGTLSCIYYTDALEIVFGSDFSWVAPNSVTFQ